MLSKEPSALLSKSFKSFFFSPILLIKSPLAIGPEDDASIPSAALKTTSLIKDIIGLIKSDTSSKKLNWLVILLNLFFMDNNSFLLDSKFKITLSIFLIISL